MGRDNFWHYLIIFICKGGILLLCEVKNKCYKHMTRVHAKTIPSHSPKQNEKLYDGIDGRVEAYVVTEKKYLDKDINVGKVASHCHIKKKLISEMLRAKYDLSFLDYLRQKRIAHARALLLDPSYMTVDAVAAASGFRTTRTFLRSFKSQEQMSPTDYRRLQELKEN